MQRELLFALNNKFISNHVSLKKSFYLELEKAMKLIPL